MLSQKKELVIMKKLLCIVLTALLLVGTLALLWPVISDIAFEAKLQTIASDWIAEHPYSSFPWYNTDGFGSFYLGSDNGYDIVYRWGSHIVATIPEYQETDEDIINCFTTSIAGYTFYPATEILTYKDGVFVPLSEVFQQGLISEAAISAAHATFNNYVAEMLCADPLAMNERELAYYTKLYPGYQNFYKDHYKRLDEQNINPCISHFKEKLELLDKYVDSQ